MIPTDLKDDLAFHVFLLICGLNNKFFCRGSFGAPALQRVALLLSYPHRRCMLLTEKTFCATASVAYDVVVQPHCKPLSEITYSSKNRALFRHVIGRERIAL